MFFLGGRRGEQRGRDCVDEEEEDDQKGKLQEEGEEEVEAEKEEEEEEEEEEVEVERKRRAVLRFVVSETEEGEGLPQELFREWMEGYMGMRW